MHCRVPSLVGLDLWKAINGEQEEKGLHSITSNRTFLGAIDTNKNTVNFKDHTVNSLNNDLIKEVLNKNHSNSTKDSSHHHGRSWFDWNFPNRSLIEEGHTREESQIFPEDHHSNPSAESVKDDLVNFIPPLMDHNPQYRNNMDSGRKGLPPTKNGRQKNFKKDNCCRFCLKNGEVQVYYESHLLKDSAGNVVCPILSKYTCPCCGATGKKAHTIRHCPLNAHLSSMLVNTYKVKRRNAAGHITSFRL